MMILGVKIGVDRGFRWSR